MTGLGAAQRKVEPELLDVDDENIYDILRLHPQLNGTLTMRWPDKSLEERFWEKVNKTDECWVWTGSLSKAGYGQFMGTPRWSRCMLASRVSWILTNGEIPAGLHVLHKCDNPPCVNPDHLWLGTAHDNMRDMVAKGRHRGTTGMRLRKSVKLTIGEVEEIQKCQDRNHVIAARFNVHPSLISKIKHGHIWRPL